MVKKTKQVSVWFVLSLFTFFTRDIRPRMVFSFLNLIIQDMQMPVASLCQWLTLALFKQLEMVTGKDLSTLSTTRPLILIP